MERHILDSIANPSFFDRQPLQEPPPLDVILQHMDPEQAEEMKESIAEMPKEQ